MTPSTTITTKTTRKMMKTTNTTTMPATATIATTTTNITTLPSLQQQHHHHHCQQPSSTNTTINDSPQGRCHVRHGVGAHRTSYCLAASLVRQYCSSASPIRSREKVCRRDGQQSTETFYYAETSEGVRKAASPLSAS
ncbi:unnamed protein product [Nesidiocoris tenuis]|uniref:Uncharacterized protein n=1 Tax=Nesidiocoris tenuis TaxID=355587 RepID=A0A6H5GLF2_9HEMI|nr:unnamed protein product [Nesidiocoris tenuis]